MELSVLCGESVVSLIYTSTHQLMNEVATAFRPYQVGLGLQLTIGAVVLEVAVLGEALAGIVGIEQVLARLRVLDTHLAE